MKLLCVILLSLSFALSGCSKAKPSQPVAASLAVPVSQRLVLPEIPAALVDPADRADYLAIHYWDNFNMKDTSLISNAEITEQAFSDFLNILNYCRPQAQEKALTLLMDRSLQADTLMFAHLSKMAEKYLYDPNSPMRNEDMYIPVLRYIANSPLIDVVQKIRPKSRLEMAMKNRVGATVADFSFQMNNGKTSRLSSIKAEYTLLFFNNPGCEDCKRVKEYITQSPLLASLPIDKFTVLALYPDEEIEEWLKTVYPQQWINGRDAKQTITQNKLYDLKAIPTLYLLDANKKVLQKDATIEQIELYLKEILK